MSLWRQVNGGLRTLFSRKARPEIADEVTHYLEETTAAFTAKGLPPEEVLRLVRLELGGTWAVHKQVRGFGWENAINTFFGDLLYAARRLAGNLNFAVSILTLAWVSERVRPSSLVERALLIRSFRLPCPARMAAAPFPSASETAANAVPQRWASAISDPCLSILSAITLLRLMHSGGSALLAKFL